MYAFFGVLFLALIGTSCQKVSKADSEVLKEEYSSLYESIFDRNGEAVITYSESDKRKVRTQAWKGLISTPFDDTSKLIEKVITENTLEAWSSLWFKELSEEHIQKLEELWKENPTVRFGLSTVLGQKGDQETLEILLDTKVTKGSTTELETALAIGRLSVEAELSEEQELDIIRRALSSKKAEITQAYLYGFYRTDKEISPASEKELLVLWEDYFSMNYGADQYIAKILMNNNLDAVLFRYELNAFEWMDVQLAIEIAQGISRNELTKHSTVVLNALLDHRNPSVIIQTLRAIKSKSELDGTLDKAILNKIGLIRGIEPAVRLEALNAIGNPNKYKSLTEELAAGNPYLSTVKYNILEKILDENKFLNELKSDTKSENRLTRFFALQQLAAWWDDLETDQKKEFLLEVKSLSIENMKTADRSMIYMMSSLFSDSTLILDSEFYLFKDLLGKFQLPADVEVYQAISGILKERFEEDALELIDSLAKKGNLALNETLASQGWDVPETEGPSNFRDPDWKGLARLGAYPVLVLETSKGVISIQMDVFNAPATISGIDELIRNRAYNGIPFHRVVPNFVVQGGDVETQDGFGGPDYVVPTEASPMQYERGKVGIASAGTDTEGSQFFVMHQWKPHLNGRYTIIGEVIEGMEIVDRIVRGDIIKRAFWK